MRVYTSSTFMSRHDLRVDVTSQPTKLAKIGMRGRSPIGGTKTFCVSTWHPARTGFKASSTTVAET